MSSSTKFIPYQRLREGDQSDDQNLEDYAKKVFFKSRSSYRFRKFSIRRRFKLKIPSLRRILRRKVKLVSSMRVSFSRVIKRLKESQSHLGDLFAGNYMFLQVTPTSFKCLQKGQDFSARYSLPRIA